MGGGIHGGFGSTKGARESFVESQKKVLSKIESNAYKLRLPEHDSQLKHIFRKDEGHLEDSPANRELLLNLAKDPTKFVGLDGYGNSWNAEIVDGGKQLWVRYQHGVINEGGLNSSPKPWDPVTGFNRNPFDRK